MQYLRLHLIYFGLFLITLAYGMPAELMIKIGEKFAPDHHLLERAVHPKTLILLGNSEWKHENTKFIGLLRKSGHTVTVALLDPSTPPVLLVYGEPQYHNIILVDGDDVVKENWAKKNIIVSSIINFIEKHNGNAFVLGRKKKAQGISTQIIQRTKLIFDDTAPIVRDFFNNHDGDVELVKSDRAAKISSIFSSRVLNAPILYRGLGHRLPQDNLLPFSLLTGTPTTFVEDRTGVVSGSSLSLVSAVQTRTNSRIVVSGSSAICSDQFIELNPRNEDFCEEVAEWNFQRTGVVDWFNMYHRMLDSATTQEVYRIKDDIEFQIDVHQLQRKNETSWALFPSFNLAQLELTMLDPHWRLFFETAKARMKHTGKKPYVTSAMPKTEGTSSISLKCPDRGGVFKFVVRLSQKGYSFLHLETLVPIRNFKHSDYERFLWPAYPYYGSTFLVLFIVVVFAILFIHTPVKSHTA